MTVDVSNCKTNYHKTEYCKSTKLINTFKALQNAVIFCSDDCESNTSSSDDLYARRVREQTRQQKASMRNSKPMIEWSYKIYYTLDDVKNPYAENYMLFPELNWYEQYLYKPSESFGRS